jgi:hypothetical protein
MTGTMPNIVGIPMCFAWQGVCVVRYCGPMRLCYAIPRPPTWWTQKGVCVIRDYALSEVCVKRGSTVPLGRLSSSTT